MTIPIPPVFPKRRGRATPLAVQATELAWAVPQVMAHRLTRMALAGHQPSPRDRREFKRMVDEKQSAFSQAWMAMAMQSGVAAQGLALSALQAWWAPVLGTGGSRHDAADEFRKAALGVLATGIAPLHRTAVANSKRLARTRLR